MKRCTGEERARNVFRAASSRVTRHVAASQRPAGAPDWAAQELQASFRGLPDFAFDRISRMIMDGVVDDLRNVDADLPSFHIDIHRFYERGIRTSRLLFTGMTVEIARIVFYHYRHFTFSADTGSQHAEMELRNVQFELELGDWRTRYFANAGPPIPYRLSQYISRWGSAPAGELPGRPVP